MNKRPLFRLQRENGIVVIIPTRDLSELGFAQLEEEADEILATLNGDQFSHVVLDFQDTGYFGSTALGFFLKLWKRVSKKHGKLVLCHVSPEELEVLQLTRLDTLWPIYATRQDAIEGLRE